jgi:hypothetical protein
MNQTLACPGCGRPLHVPEELLRQPVMCPACRHTFSPHPEDLAAPVAAEAGPPASGPPPRPAPRLAAADDYPEDRGDGRPDPGDGDDAYAERPRRRRPGQRPGQVQAIAVMMLVGGILAGIHALTATLFTAFVCCLWPGTYYAVVMSVFAITKGSQLLGEEAYKQPPPRTVAILQIINIINGDVVNLVLGILALVFLKEPEVRRYFRG